MKKVKLGEVCEILSGYAFKSSQFNDNKIGLPLIRIRDVERGFSDTYFEGTYPEEYLIKNGDLLITMDGSFILKKWEGDLALLNQRVCKIKITDKSVDEGYISWLIPKFLKEIEDKTPFVTVKHLSVAKIKDISFVLPNKLEQKLIAKKLNTISQIYDFRKIQSEKFNELVKSRFNEMFGDPLNNNKKFAVKTGQQCFKFSSGKFLDKHDRVFEGYPAYGGNGIAWKSRKYLIDNPTIIIGRVGAYCGNVRTTHGKVWISDNAIYIKEFKNSDFNLVFLLELMKVIDFSKF
ncbi:TPA: restriction endonuclease subunit S, partial [Streptococcus pneumoniae]